MEFMKINAFISLEYVLIFIYVKRRNEEQLVKFHYKNSLKFQSILLLIMLNGQTQSIHRTNLTRNDRFDTIEIPHHSSKQGKKFVNYYCVRPHFRNKKDKCQILKFCCLEKIKILISKLFKSLSFSLRIFMCKQIFITR